MRVELTEHPAGNQRFEILLGEMVYVIRLDEAEQLADWIYELHPTAIAEKETLQAELGRVIIAIRKGLTDKPSLERIEAHIMDLLKAQDYFNDALLTKETP